MIYAYSWCSFNGTRLPSEEFLAMSECTLNSTKSFKEESDKIIFYTDAYGKNAFVDLLNYFDDVVIIENFGNGFSNTFFYYEKYYVANLLQRNFCHLDFYILFVDKPLISNTNDIITYDIFDTNPSNTDSYMFFNYDKNINSINLALEMFGSINGCPIFSTMFDFINDNCTIDKMPEFTPYKQDAISLYMKWLCKTNGYKIFLAKYYSKIDNLNIVYIN